MKRLLSLVLLLAPGAALAQMDHSAMDHAAMDSGSMDHGSMDMAWMSMDGMGSGTSRLPLNEAMRGVHLMPSSRDMVMAQATVWPVYTDQGGPRGSTKFYAQSMAMVMWLHDLGGGTKLTGQAMLSSSLRCATMAIRCSSRPARRPMARRWSIGSIRTTCSWSYRRGSMCP